MDSEPQPDLKPHSGANGLRAVLGLIALACVLIYNYGYKLTGKDLGELCMKGEDCRSGLCYLQGIAGTCTRSCSGDGDCGAGLRCNAGESQRVCVKQGHVAFGQPCKSRYDCISDLCLTYKKDALSEKGDDFCSQRCPDGKCPEGATCGEISDGKLCVPNAIAGIDDEDAGDDEEERLKSAMVILSKPLAKIFSGDGCKLKPKPFSLEVDIQDDGTPGDFRLTEGDGAPLHACLKKLLSGLKFATSPEGFTVKTSWHPK